MKVGMIKMKLPKIMADNKKTLAISKSMKISKAQQYTLIEVLIASLILGVGIVLSIWLVKYIIFNNKLSSEYNKTIDAYEKTIINVGACVAGNDKKLSDAELAACNPNETDISSVPDSLRYNVLMNLANNANLESVARKRQSVCYDGKDKIDFSKEYQKATTEKEKEQALAMMSMCSALRVVPDALPGQENPEATVASLNQIFLLSNIEPESLSVKEIDTSDEELLAEADRLSLGIIPVAFEVKSPSGAIQTLLENMEISIRTFNITRATFEWSNGALEVKANANAYFANGLTVRELTKTVYGGDKRTTTGTTTPADSTTTVEGQ